MIYNQKYGKPQGNELVYGCDIIRRLDTFEFNLIERFKSSRAAHEAYRLWMSENNLPDNKSKHHLDPKAWNYARPILGFDENGEPIMYDSWGEINET